MKFVNANITPSMAYVESLTVNLSNNEVDMIGTALRAYSENNYYYAVTYTNLADDLNRYIAEGAYAAQLDRILNTGHFDDELRNGKMIATIKFLRSATDCGLAAGKHAVERRKEFLNI